MAICERCSLHAEVRSVKVPSRGSDRPSVLIVGEAPGSQEDQYNQTFVGASGKKLDEYLARVGISPATVRWTNIVRCYPKGADGRPRRPSDVEVQACIPYLYDEIEACNPAVILTLGNTPLQALTGRKSITQARGRIYELPIGGCGGLGNILVRKIIPTIHPASVLYGNANHEPMILQDLALARSVLDGGDSAATTRVVVLDTVEKVSQYTTKLKALYRAGKIPFVALDLETWSEDPERGGLTPYHSSSKILCVSLSHERGIGFVIPYRCRQSTFGEPELREVDALLTNCFAEVPLAGHNMFFDIKWLTLRSGIQLRRKALVWDSLLASRMIHADTIEHKLDSLASRFTTMIQHKSDMKDSLKALGKGHHSMDSVDTNVFYAYAAADVDAVVRLYEALQPEMDRLGLNQALRDIVVGSNDMFVHLSINGVAIDQEAVQTGIAEMEEERRAVAQAIEGLGVTQSLQAIATADWVADVHTFLDERAQAASALWQGAFLRPPSESELVAMEQEALGYTANFDPALRKSLKALWRKAPPSEPVVTLNLQANDQIKTILFRVFGVRPDTSFVSKKTGEASVDRAALWHYTEVCAERINYVLSALKADGAERVVDRSEDGSGVVLFRPTVMTEADRANAKTEVRNLARVIDFLGKLSEWKKISKLISTYYSPLLQQSIHPDGLGHCEVLNSSQDTGRTSVLDPHIQVYPRGSKAKRCFVSRYAGGLLLSADYGQHELRVMACISGDPGLIEIFSSGQDPHVLVASRIFGVPVEQVTKSQRSIAKAFSFGIPYGMTKYGLAARTGKSEEEVEELFGFIFGQFPLLEANLIQRYQREGSAHHGVKTPMGRWRPIPDYDVSALLARGATNKEVEQALAHANRQAVNTPIQSAASDITALAGVAIDDYLLHAGAHTKLWGFIHDALLFDSHPLEVVTVANELTRIMVTDIPSRYDWITVPLAAEIDLGVNWGQMCPAVVKGNTLTIKGVVGDYAPLERVLLDAGCVLQSSEQIDIDGKAGVKAVVEVVEQRLGSVDVRRKSQYTDSWQFNRIWQ